MNTVLTDESRRLIQLGAALFLLGLLTGFAIPLFENPRMGLSSHLEGVLNGMFLMVLGLIWQSLYLSGWQRKLAKICALFGTFANWGGTLLAALWGTGKMTPIASGALQGSPAQEGIVSALLLALALFMLVLSVLIVWGLRRHPQVSSSHLRPPVPTANVQ